MITALSTARTASFTQFLWSLWIETSCNWRSCCAAVPKVPVSSLLMKCSSDIYELWLQKITRVANYLISMGLLGTNNIFQKNIVLVKLPRIIWRRSHYVHLLLSSAWFILEGSQSGSQIQMLYIPHIYLIILAHQVNQSTRTGNRPVWLKTAPQKKFWLCKVSGPTVFGAEHWSVPSLVWVLDWGAPKADPGRTERITDPPPQHVRKAWEHDAAWFRSS